VRTTVALDIRCRKSSSRAVKSIGFALANPTALDSEQNGQRNSYLNPHLEFASTPVDAPGK
jgi:hypothetical protein